MTTYTKRVCYECGVRLPQPDMTRTTIEVESGSSEKTITGSEVVFAIFGNKNARKSVGRTFTSPNKRIHKRNKTVWMCYRCAGVESSAEKQTRIENERILKQQEEAAKQARIENERILKQQEEVAKKQAANERRELLESLYGKNGTSPSPQLLASELSRSHRLSEGVTFTRFKLVFCVQTILVLLSCIYIPVSEIYLHRNSVALKNFAIYNVVAFLLIAFGMFCVSLLEIIIAGQSPPGAEHAKLVWSPAITFLLCIIRLVGICVVDYKSGFRFFHAPFPSGSLQSGARQIAPPPIPAPQTRGSSN